MDMLWILIAVQLVHFVGRGWSLTQDVLISSLLTHYDVDAAPLPQNSSYLNVDVDFSVKSLQEINEKNQAVSLFLWVGAVWTDTRLTWLPSNYSGVDKVVIQASRIWTPDLVIRNSMIGLYDNDDKDKFRASVEHTGLVRYWTGGKTVISCAMDLTFFPFDTQACYIHVMSWTYTIKHLKLSVAEASLGQDEVFDGQWEMIAAQSEYLNETYLAQNMFSSVLHKMLFKRKPQFYVRTIVFPCILLSILALFMFLIPVDGGDKVSYGMTVLLSFTVFQLVIVDSMPRTSDQNPIISIYLSAVMVLTATCILFSLFVLHLRSHTTPLPRWFYLLTFRLFSCSSRPSTRSLRNNRLNCAPPKESIDDTRRERETAAAIWDRFFFVFFCTVLVITTIVMLYVYPLVWDHNKDLNDTVIIS